MPLVEIVDCVRKYEDKVSQNLEQKQNPTKVWALINQVLVWCFCCYGLWLTSQIHKSVDISKVIDINQSISVKQFYPLVEIGPRIFCFPIIYHNSLPAYVRKKAVSPGRIIECTLALMMKKILMYNLESDFQHGMWDLCREIGGKYLRLWKDVVLMFAACRKWGGKGKGVKWLERF